MWPEPIRRLLAHSFLRFLLVGGFAAGVNIGSRFLFSTSMPYGWAVLAAYLCGMITAWTLSRAFVFRRSGDGWRQELLRFGLVNLAAAAQVWLIALGLRNHVLPTIGFAWHPDAVAHVIGVAVPVFTSYLGHKHFSFAARRPGVAGGPPGV
ncbi:GtrA family protein [Roseomonas xinghualingensis]|uniref:GtrA family protein n=1 Tax=Roseomonas xinghualingensis TaxID=2986475 RepID=UPI0021F0A877|nr:GtrA family protein [Roseomonas sp. SXEYE001]MCV4209822.1 GtrA family protein [Roseomonas sp. SXEYE001]